MIIAKKSPLRLLNFLLLKNGYDTTPSPSNDNLNILEIFDSYPIEIDFAVKNDIAPYYQIFTKIAVNNTEPHAIGYSLFIEGVGIFEIDKALANDPKSIADLIYVSGISICINNLRSILSINTSCGPFGKYTLPSIDVVELLKDKGVINPSKPKK